MFGINYFKADSSTFVVKTVNGKTVAKGRGLSFFYNRLTTSIIALPVNVQEAPFIFDMQTADYQKMTIQGQLSYQIAEPEKAAEMMNFTLNNKRNGWVSDDPTTLSDRVLRAVSAVLANRVATANLRDLLRMSHELISHVRGNFQNQSELSRLGIVLLDIMIVSIQPTPETAKALEAGVRESILQGADDAVYGRRKSAVEQERIIREAELQASLALHRKEQEIAELKIANERTLMRAQLEMERERITAGVHSERSRQELVALESENHRKIAADEAFAIEARMNAFRALPVENLKAMSLARMNPEQLMALAFESLAQNADKIGELNITPELFGQVFQKEMVIPAPKDKKHSN